VKKFFVIGNPINHSLSPKLHNYWFKKNNIDGTYEKKKLNKNDLESFISKIRKGEIEGANITVPFKNTVVPFLDQLTPSAKDSRSVNTIFKENNKVIGHNTDIGGFELALKHINYDVKNKKIFILGAGGVVSSIILALKNMGVEKIILSNRTKEKAKYLKDLYPNIEIIDWGEVADFDMIINATSLGLKKNDEIKLNYPSFGSNKFFYDVIYNPNQTKFLLNAKKYGNRIENGKMMFIFQAHQAFNVWHKILPDIDGETIKLLDQ
tara:strand:- start:461 stop:1255 length:795 start_codon:yes stop_codon:yes gene_type:complete